jgi:2-oxoisovalerate dehydrogenase E1 component
MLLPSIEPPPSAPAQDAIAGFEAEVRTALLIRRTEQTLLDLFAQGLLFGTVHTCIGQEFVGVAAARGLEPHDSVFSNHRGHGHYLARCGDVEGLVAEVMGKATGVCAGRGGSQHLQRDSYYSNGIQGGIVPVATGLAFAHAHRGSGGIAVVFVGDGTLGQGAVYESFNIASQWSLPILFVCENNYFAQSTSQAQTLAGDIAARAAAFGIETLHASTWDWRGLCTDLAAAAGRVRSASRPLFARVDTFRLMAHSKGDDNRPPDFVRDYWDRDPLVRLEKAHGHTSFWTDALREIDARIAAAVEAAKAAPFAPPTSLFPATSAHGATITWAGREFPRERVVHGINAGLRDALEADPRVVIIGEDVESPYGGAFKCTRDLSDLFPGRVRNTPISELAITGIGNGMALQGLVPVVEIMFGDFLTLAMDQWVNHAAKFRFMFADKVRIPLVIRTPMGGRRGYASTHSQSLEKHFVGLPDTAVYALHHRMCPRDFYRRLLATVDRPTLVVENKLLYGQYANSAPPPGFQLSFSDPGLGAVARLRPALEPAVTVVVYGGVALEAEEAARQAFTKHEIPVEVLMLSRIYPLDLRPILASVRRTGRLVVVEEGQGFAALGAEVIAGVAETGAGGFRCGRVTAAAVPIPAARPLEEHCLPQVEDIVRKIVELAEQDR